METNLSSERNRSLFVPAGLSALGILAGQWTPMRTESIDRTGLFVMTKEYVQPRSIFDLVIWLGEGRPPIHAVVTASFVERTWDGYGIWAQIASLSTEDKARWEHFYRKVATSAEKGYSESLRLSQLLEPQRIAVLNGALPSAVLGTLRGFGVTVVHVAEPAQAVALAQRGEVDLVIAALGDARYNAQALTEQLHEKGTRAASLLVTESGQRADFETSLYAGATKIVARPCATSILVTRILEVMYAAKRAQKHDQAPQKEAKPRTQKAQPKRRTAPSLLGQVKSWFASR